VLGQLPAAVEIGRVRMMVMSRGLMVRIGPVACLIARPAAGGPLGIHGVAVERV
jgi:hypothetical protein